MIILSNLSKAYGPKTLFSQVSLRLLRGEKLGLVGPNGAGKTTLFSIILGATWRRTGGKVELRKRQNDWISCPRKVHPLQMKPFLN